LDDARETFSTTTSTSIPLEICKSISALKVSYSTGVSKLNVSFVGPTQE